MQSTVVPRVRCETFRPINYLKITDSGIGCMHLSIIIVNWNSIEFTKACIASILETVHNLEYEVIVVDNASRDHCELLPDLFPGVQVFGMPENLGFSQANNTGAALSRGRVLLFLNPDTVVLEAAISRLVNALESDVKFGAAGARLLNGDHTLQVSCVQPFPTISNQLLGIEWLIRRWPTLALWGREAMYGSQETPAVVNVVSGACLMMRRDVFEAVGGFSTDYFMYAEEMDLCQKVRTHGWKVLHVPNARIVHFGGQSTKERGDGFASVLIRESVFRLLQKFRGTGYAHLYRVMMLLSAGFRLVLLSPMLVWPTPAGLRNSARRAWGKWRHVARWALALEGWATELGTQPTGQQDKG